MSKINEKIRIFCAGPHEQRIFNTDLAGFNQLHDRAPHSPSPFQRRNQVRCPSICLNDPVMSALPSIRGIDQRYRPSTSTDRGRLALRGPFKVSRASSGIHWKLKSNVNVQNTDSPQTHKHRPNIPFVQLGNFKLCNTLGFFDKISALALATTANTTASSSPVQR